MGLMECIWHLLSDFIVISICCNGSRISLRQCKEVWEVCYLNITTVYHTPTTEVPFKLYVVNAYFHLKDEIQLLGFGMVLLTELTY